MHRRQWLAIAMVVVGASLLIAASFASASTSSKQALKKGGIFRYGLVGASTQVDPQLAYVTTAWSLEYATAAKLYNYPDKKGPAGSKLIPEVASKFTVSKNGKVYTFTIRPGFVFSDGSKVTAKNFKYAIERTANHDLASPGAPFITDPTGTNIVGAKAVNDGKTTKVSGVIASGNKLIIKLTQARRDVHGEDHHAVLPGDLDEDSADQGSRQRQQDEPAVGGSVLHDAQRPGPAHAAAAQPALQERARAARGRTTWPAWTSPGT